MAQAPPMPVVGGVPDLRHLRSSLRPTRGRRRRRRPPGEGKRAGRKPHLGSRFHAPTSWWTRSGPGGPRFHPRVIRTGDVRTAQPNGYRTRNPSRRILSRQPTFRGNRSEASGGGDPGGFPPPKQLQCRALQWCRGRTAGGINVGGRNLLPMPDLAECWHMPMASPSAQPRQGSSASHCQGPCG